MKKDLGAQPAVFPMPVLMVAAYDKNGKVNVMNAAWGQTASSDKVVLFISEGHKTTKNIRETGAFTVGIADRAHVTEADFFGIATGNKIDDKFERTGLHQTKSARVNAPVIDEFPIVMECELDEIIDDGHIHAIVGKVVNVAADDNVLSENGKIDITKADPIMFDNFQSGYYAVGEKVGQAWDIGKKLM